MLNRRHIRIKVMQVMYAYYISDRKSNINELKSQMNRSMWLFYELYLFLLLFLREYLHFIELYDDEIKASGIILSKVNFHQRFYTGSTIVALNDNKAFNDELNKRKIFWDKEDREILRKLFVDFKMTESYTEFIRKDEISVSDEFEVLSFFLKNYCANSLLFTQFVEDRYINWHDDEKSSIQMTLKSLGAIISDPEAESFLQPLSHDNEANQRFAEDLIVNLVENEEELTTHINNKIDKWEPSRIPLLDNIVLKIGLAELLYFPTIPVKVTINECIELVKNYSLPSSKKFINAVLDNLLIELEKSGKIIKKGIGLMDK